MSRFVDLFAFHRRSSVEPQNAAAWTPNLRGGRLSVLLCCSGAIGIGIIALTGYVLANASIASLDTEGKPAAAVTALALILLGAGLLVLRSPAPAGLLTARRAALGVIVLAAADLLSAAFSPNVEEWKVWAARGDVPVHAYPITAFLLIASASALVFVTTRKDFAGHLIASAVLSICGVLSFGYFLQVPSFLNPSRRIAPVAPTTLGIVLISAGVLLARPRGWVVPLLARTPAGLRSRLLLAAAIVVPFTALALRALIVDAPWYTHEVGLTVIVAVNVFFSATIVLSLGVILHKRESDRARLGLIVESSDDAIIETSSAGLIESWNGGAELIYGYTAAEAIGHSVTMLAPPERQDEAPRVLGRIRRGERIDPFETVRVAKDGRRVDVWMSVSRVLDDAGKVIGFSSIAHDITGRKKAKEELRASEEQYRTLFEAMDQGFCVIDMLFDPNGKAVDYRFVEINPAFERQTGLQQALGKTIRQMVPNHESNWFEIYGEVSRTGEAIRFENAAVAMQRYFDVFAFRIGGEGSQRVGILIGDITERKQTEEALEKSEAALIEAQRTAAVGHWDWSAVTGASTWSEETYRLLGIPNGSATPSFELFVSTIVPEDRRRFEDVLTGALEPGGESDIHIDVGITTPAGQALALSTRILLDRDASGNVVKLHGTIQDVTQRVANAQALRDSEAALAEAQQIAHVGSAIVYPETGEIRASDEYFRIFDLEPRPGTPFSAFLDRIHEEDRRVVKAALEVTVSSGTFDAQFRIVGGDGSIRFAHGIARLQQSDSRASRFIGTVENVTERRLAEDALRHRTESLERSNDDLERFNRAAVGRELRMIELKQQVNDLCAQSGQPAPYALPEEHALAKETS